VRYTEALLSTFGNEIMSISTQARIHAASTGKLMVDAPLDA
jgi:hypothetical protein